MEVDTLCSGYYHSFFIFTTFFILSSIIPIGVLLGYNIILDVSIEGEFNYGIAGGDIDFFIGSGDTDMWTLAGYGVYRHFFDGVFIKAKAGFIHEDIRMEYEFFGISIDDTETDSGFSAGIGCGYRFDDELGIEAGHTVIEEDVDFLSVGITYSF